MKKLFLLATLLFALSGFAQSSTVKVISTATSGTITLPNTQQDIIFLHDAGLTISLTIAFPLNPCDGQMVIIASAGGITNLNITSVVGSVLSALTGMSIGGNATWIYSIDRNKWFRIR